MAGFKGKFVSIDHRLPDIDKVFQEAPNETAYQMRRWTGRSMAKWRKNLIRTTSKAGKALAAHGAFNYDVFPKKQTRKAVGTNLKDIRARFLSFEKPILGLEFGGPFFPKGGGFLTVPVGKYRDARVRRAAGIKTAAEFNSANSPGLFPVKAEKGGKVAAYLARQIGRGSGGEPRVDVVFALMRRVDYKAELGMMRTWDKLQGYRDRTLGEYLGFVTKFITTGKRTG